MDAGQTRPGSVRPRSWRRCCRKAATSRLKIGTLDYNSAYQPQYSALAEPVPGLGAVPGVQRPAGLEHGHVEPHQPRRPQRLHQRLEQRPRPQGGHGEEPPRSSTRTSASPWPRSGRSSWRKNMPFIPYSMPSGTGSFSLAWPWYGNYGVFKTYGTFTDAVRLRIPRSGTTRPRRRSEADRSMLYDEERGDISISAGRRCVYHAQAIGAP